MQRTGKTNAEVKFSANVRGVDYSFGPPLPGGRRSQGEISTVSPVYGVPGGGLPGSAAQDQASGSDRSHVSEFAIHSGGGRGDGFRRSVGRGIYQYLCSMPAEGQEVQPGADSV